VNRFAFSLRQPGETSPRNQLYVLNGGGHIEIDPTPAADSHRYFALQPIFTLERRTFGYEALYRTDWENHFSGDSNTATRTMIDNWLLYGFEDLTGGCRTFLNCTRESLLSGFLTLLPPWAVFEILESVEPDEEALRAL